MPHDSSTCPVCIAGHRSGMSDSQFHAFLNQCREELHMKQKQLCQQPLDTPYQFNLETGSFTLGTSRMSCIAIGSYCPSRSTWLWSWANDAFSEKVRRPSERFKNLFEITGFRVFVEEGVKATQQDAEDFAAMAVHVAEGIGFWRSTSDDLEQYLCLVETD